MSNGPPAPTARSSWYYPPKTPAPPFGAPGPKNPSAEAAKKIPPLHLTEEQLADVRRRWDGMFVGAPPRPGLGLRFFAAINRIKHRVRRMRRRGTIAELLLLAALLACAVLLIASVIQ